MKLKKTLLLAPLAIAAVPIATFAASCGDGDAVVNYDLLPTYTGQADQLIALGIKPDYYPVQLDATGPFSYLTNPGLFMPMQNADFKTKFAERLKTLIPADQGTSWWNQQALASSTEKGSDPEYWTHKGGEMVLYERYLLDDSDKVIYGATAPKHFNSPETFIETNFRNSRDPYTRIPKNIIQGLLDEAEYAKLNDSEKSLVDSLLTVGRNLEGVNPNLKAGDGKPLPSGRAQREATESESWLYNDFVFARFWHVNFLDNETYQKSDFKAWEVDPSDPAVTTKWIFSQNPEEEILLRNLFYESTYQDSESQLKAVITARQAALARRTLASQPDKAQARINAHHPIYEQQDAVGAAPMFEGAMRDNLLYLYTLAERVSKAATGTSDTSKRLEGVFAKTPERWAKMQKALDNANKISRDLRARMLAFNQLVKAAGNPTFGLFTLAPGVGAGASTIQSSSKFSFVYRELGFSQPMPSNLANYQLDTSSPEALSSNLFNMDDNGWWWNLSNPAKNLNIAADRTQLFAGKFDLGFITANNAQFDSLKSDEVAAINSLWKAPQTGNEAAVRAGLANLKVDYNLWNEGLKAPFGMHMLIDEILSQFNAKYRDAIIASGSYTAATYDAQLAKAADWGSYFTQDFLA